jgi:integrase/recombinase XerD
MPKCDRNGQAAIWTDDQVAEVLADLSPSMRALFSICRYTGCRVSEARQLQA